MSILAGIGWDAIAAISAATFYAPISKAKKWSWETTWACAGFVSWILLPLAVSLALLPDFCGFYSSLDQGVVLKTFFFGCMWGIGNVNFGLAMRYLGISLGTGVGLGVTMGIGTLLPPILHGEATSFLTTQSGVLAFVSTLVALVGVGVVSYAGRLKENSRSAANAQFDLRKGLVLAVVCGVFSACMSLAIDAAQPVTAAALHAGVKPLYSGLPSYLIIMAGGALVNLGYCFARLAFAHDLSLRADLHLPAAHLLRNTAMAVTGGTMWYLQFFFYAWGSSNIPAAISYVNWMLLTSGSVLFGGLTGIALGEWRGASVRAKWSLALGLATIIAATNIAGAGMAISAR
jgi:L-rhamnose-H+ transport protein